MGQMESFKSDLTSLRNRSIRKNSVDSDSASSLGSDSFSSKSSKQEKRKQLGFTTEEDEVITATDESQRWHSNPTALSVSSSRGDRQPATLVGKHVHRWLCYRMTT